MASTYCDTCRSVREFGTIERPDTFRVRGENVTVHVAIAICPVCGDEIGDEALDTRAFEDAYAVYRARHGLLQPSEIHSIRSMYGLGQKAFARLLGFGEVTLHRYENGALQSASHDQMLRYAQDIGNVRQLLVRNGSRLTSDQRATLEQRLQELSPDHEGLVIREEGAAYAAGPAVNKLREMMVHFCGQPLVWRTKLNKLLFYADFLNRKRHGVPISGCRYVHMQYGPVPANFYTLQASLVDSASLEEECASTGDCTGTVFRALRPADVSVFSETELGTLEDVAHAFEGWSALAVTEFSHKEPAWCETQNRDTIPYEYASQLQLD
ncbi:MAG: DUF4065 domain-containing protein [Coriobacteriia bacterium]|nr:DUF4065 domain-containing protein [Coriobacteriia bacterium]